MRKELGEELQGSPLLKEPGNLQSQEGFPSDTTQRCQQSEVSRKHAETPDQLTTQLKTSRPNKSLFLLN